MNEWCIFQVNKGKLSGEDITVLTKAPGHSVEGMMSEQQYNIRGMRKMECWCGGIWRRNLNIMPGIWSLSWGPIIFQQQNTCFKQLLTRNPYYNKIDQSRAILVETRIGPDTLPLATTSSSRHCWGTLICPLEHCLETSAMSKCYEHYMFSVGKKSRRAVGMLCKLSKHKIMRT